MAGSFSMEPPPVPLARTSAVIQTYLYTPDAPDPSDKYQLCANLLCLGITKSEGADPGSARFRYIFVDPSIDPTSPRQIEDVYPFNARGPLVWRTDSQVAVFATRDDGYHEMLFHGFLQVPQANLADGTEIVSLTALGGPIREWDTPMAGAVMRDADKADTGDADIPTDNPARFNPDGKPNASAISAEPYTGDSGTAPAQYPTFLGPVWPANAINGKTIRM